MNTSGAGALKNSEVGGEMIASDTGSIVYREVSVTKPANKGCKVATDENGVVGRRRNYRHRNPKHHDGRQGDSAVIQSANGVVLARLIITNCQEPLAFLNGTHTIGGAVASVPNGATINLTHVKATETLWLDEGPAAGIEGPLTLEGRKATGSGAYTALSVTT